MDLFLSMLMKNSFKNKCCLQLNGKILLIPDVHQDLSWANEILDRHDEEVDYIVLLGDYFDSFNPKFSVKETCVWLKQIKEKYKEKIIFLLGNHDLSYYEACFNKKDKELINFASGFTNSKAEKIKKESMLSFFQECEPMVLCNGYLVSHAGISPNFWHPVLNKKEALLSIYCDLTQKILPNCHIFDNKLLGAGLSRGGSQTIGGIFWLDFHEEFTDDIPYPQIVGHTGSNDYEIRQCGRSFCIDGNQTTYALLTEENIIFKKENCLSFDYYNFDTEEEKNYLIDLIF